MQSDLSVDEVVSAAETLDEIYHAVTLNHAIVYATWARANSVNFNHRTAIKFTNLMPGLFPGLKK